MLAQPLAAGDTTRSWLLPYARFRIQGHRLTWTVVKILVRFGYPRGLSIPRAQTGKMNLTTVRLGFRVPDYGFRVGLRVEGLGFNDFWLASGRIAKSEHQNIFVQFEPWVQVGPRFRLLGFEAQGSRHQIIAASAFFSHQRVILRSAGDASLSAETPSMALGKDSTQGLFKKCCPVEKDLCGFPC